MVNGNGLPEEVAERVWAEVAAVISVAAGPREALR
jgi:hypothetical protein